MEKQERTVIHLQLHDRLYYQSKEKDMSNDLHFYFGSLKALTLEFPKDVIGIEYSSLRNVGLSETKPYQNAKCIIRKGTLKAVEGGRGQSKL